ncbi:MAG: pole-organizing protein PopZ [Caulobacter sp.]|nr:pole-organizing protein PopZ [Caulobacter sp.]
MSDQTTQEPTMEEILASIRRIISEDDTPAEVEAEAPEAAEPESVEPESAPEFVAEPESESVAAESGEDVLELTDPIEPEPEPVESVGDIDVYSPPAPEPEPETTTSIPNFSREEVAENLVGDHAAGLAASAFGSLSAAIGMPRDERTLDDVVRELLRPLLKQWLDDNLPRIVELKVEEEVQRIARGRVGG